MSEQDPNAPAPEVADDDPEDAILGATATLAADGKKMISIPLDTVVGLRRGERAANRRVKELEPISAEAAELKSKLDQAAPYINAILTNPQLRAQALAAASGRQVPVNPAQDQEAIDFAKSMGWYHNDNFTPNAEQARQVLTMIDGRSKRAAEDAVRPYAGMTLESHASTNLSRAIAATDSDGVPYATAESIREVAATIGNDLLSSNNQNMIEMVLAQAAWKDRQKGRTPKLPDEPLYLERSGRARQTVAIDPEQARRNEKLGISDAEWKKASAALDRGGRVTFEGA